ncbi:hypothetical protein HZA43_00035 [Candidatus Peregrinibacteria bacterium]|nr:hypothetical protein [Candidatus Peregrinibacteria bacterium]
MTFEVLRKKVQDFDKKVGWDKTEFSQLVGFMQEELDRLKFSANDPDRVNHLLTDLLVLIMQIAYRYDTDFDFELAKWFRSAEQETK